MLLTQNQQHITYLTVYRVHQTSKIHGRNKQHNNKSEQKMFSFLYL